MVTLRSRAIEAPDNKSANPKCLEDHDLQTPDRIKPNNAVSGYEQSREERIKENLQRMQQLGIPNLSVKLSSFKKTSPKRINRTPSEKKSPICSLPPRRSSRLQNVTPVSYVELPPAKKEKLGRGGDLVLEGLRPELYTEEHEKLLASSCSSWDLFQDGYGSDGKRIYDPVNGKTCHQCRQKTLGQRTSCRNCQIVQGQFCGDCLYMRYGENVLEANQNPDWICPVCRGICNCSLCRIKKGWVPTGPLYKRVMRQGFKSVAHYLIQTRRSPIESEDQVSDTEEKSSASARKSLQFTDTVENSESSLEECKRLDIVEIREVDINTSKEEVEDVSVESDKKLTETDHDQS